MYNPDNNSGLTGRIFEEEIFGSTRENPKSQKYRDLYKKAEKNNGYLSYNESLDFAKEVQVEDPTDPKIGTANNLHATVVDKLFKERLLANNDDYGKVRFYSSLGTPLDVYHGVDGFIEYDDVIITMDGTINKNKDNNSVKADIILEEMPDPKFEKEKYLEYIKTKANKIVALIKEQKSKNQKIQ